MIELVNADSIRIPLADKSVHMCVTSPPYWGLRKYSGTSQAVWPSVSYAPMPKMSPVHIPGEKSCNHTWGEEQLVEGPQKWDTSTGESYKNQTTEIAVSRGTWCQKCNAWRGMLGLEPTIEMYVGHIVFIMREVRRVLHDGGTLWLNIGDSYFGGADRGKAQSNTVQKKRKNGLKPKDFCMIPSRVALALQADGWYLRNDIIWAKGASFCECYAGSVMPEAAKDRCTKAHEHVFLLSKNEQYFWDKEAIKEAAGIKHNPRDVWTINQSFYSGAHYAVFPPELVEPCIAAGSSQYGCCSKCGAQWDRRKANKDDWRPSCNHDAERVPATVLDIFAGSGTTGEVARKMGRNSVLIDLSHEYLAEQAAKRLEIDKWNAWHNGVRQADTDFDGLPMFGNMRQSSNRKG